MDLGLWEIRVKSNSGQVLQSLPPHWQELDQKSHNNQLVYEICADYKAVLAAIHGIRRLPNSASHKQYKKYQALYQLLEELEKEITAVLSRG